MSLSKVRPFGSGFLIFSGYLAAGCQQQDIRLPSVCIRQDIGSPGKTRRRGELRAVEGRERLPSEDQRHGFVAKLHDHPPSLDHLVCVSRPQRD